MMSKLISFFLKPRVPKKTKQERSETNRESNKKTKETMKRPFGWLSKKYNIHDKKLQIAVIVLVAFFLVFSSFVKSFLFIALFIIIAATSKLIQEFFPFVVGFDLVLFVTVLSSMHYGWIAGAVVGCTSSFIGSMYRIRQQMDTAVLPLFGYVAVSAIVPYLVSLDLLFVGVISSLVYGVMMSLIFLHLRADFFNTATFFTTTIAFNYWVFLNLGPFVASLM